MGYGDGGGKGFLALFTRMVVAAVFVAGGEQGTLLASSLAVIFSLSLGSAISSSTPLPTADVTFERMSRRLRHRCIDVLLGPSFAIQKPALEFILRGGAEVVFQAPQTLRRAMQLMEKYRDMPMDFADATLVALAEERETDEIFTLDRRGFATYRIQSRKSFTIYPE